MALEAELEAVLETKFEGVQLEYEDMMPRLFVWVQHKRGWIEKYFNVLVVLE